LNVVSPSRVLEVDDRARGDDVLGWKTRRRRALRDQVFDLLADLRLRMADAKEADAARTEDALPVEAGGAAPAVIADVEIRDLVFEVGRFAEAQPNLVDARDVHQPDAVPRGHVVHGLAVERVVHRHPAKSHVVREDVEEAAPR